VFHHLARRAVEVGFVVTKPHKHWGPRGALGVEATKIGGSSTKHRGILAISGNLTIPNAGAGI